ncbi:Bdr family repetitive protein (plasmid) [Borrelia miyamotoi]|uniref:Bdr family repetitive protein n=1 Tax=Borrelia miyamotoi TaxID=47466 RepID=A0AAX3JQ61_9SPIR|nr:Bdr family repetitive protein [Borrelia miyamotoi]WAZ72888.1 Bdr family repetitive protein [Borrelia miyamotoi]WVI05718.1 Bdr family repetitive protein [Borrelia miyamotoi]
MTAAIPQTVITRQMVFNELVKAGINKDIADDLAYRYYKNELTHKNIEFLKENFNIKLEKVESSLKADIEKVETNLKSDIRELNNKIDNKLTNLIINVDNVKNEISLVKKDIYNLEKNNKWIFSLTFALWLTVLGGFIALILN